jgi:AGCS family alanine or glycine:cation symporter
VGVATAVALGGPGAVLWMWLTGVFGIATKYAEALLAVEYRVVNEQGQMAGGPMYALERGLKMKWLAVLFAAFTAVAAFGIGCMVQANSISGQLQDRFSVSPWISGGVMAAVTAAVILGGIKSIARFCELWCPSWPSPTWSAAWSSWRSTGRPCRRLRADRRERVHGPGGGGRLRRGGMIAGASLRGGPRAVLQRVGAGQRAHRGRGGADPPPVRQALVSSTGTFWDTVVVCLLTGLVVVASGEWQKGCRAPRSPRPPSPTPHRRPHRPDRGLLTFVFSTILAGPTRGEGGGIPLRPASADALPDPVGGGVLLGSVVSLKAVWSFADIANGLMAIPNLISLIALNGVIVKRTRDYLWSGQIHGMSRSH